MFRFLILLIVGLGAAKKVLILSGVSTWEQIMAQDHLGYNGKRASTA